MTKACLRGGPTTTRKLSTSSQCCCCEDNAVVYCKSCLRDCFPKFPVLVRERDTNSSSCHASIKHAPPCTFSSSRVPNSMQEADTSSATLPREASVPAGGGIEQETGSTEMASLLQLLSCEEKQREEVGGTSRPSGAGGGRQFECKTCSRRFPTFQALGGHRTSHTRPRGRGDGCNPVQKMRPKLHSCPVCGLVFPMGQALGGHMRRHKPAAPDAHAAREGGARELRWLDLNLPPLENELQLQSLGFRYTAEGSATRDFSSYSSHSA